MNNFKKSILVVSHPDDECIFFSSLLEKVTTLVICYGKIRGAKEISNGRIKSLNSYPLRNLKIINLNINQAIKSFPPPNWLDIKEKFSGIMGGYQENSYDLNFKNLIYELKKIVPENSTIITHNPWGEYGHSEHCQVFKACFAISKKTNSKLFVSGYMSNLSQRYAINKLHLLKKKIYKFESNIKVYKLLKKNYIINKCWNWYKDYDLPLYEYFYKINLSYSPSSSSNKKNIDKLKFNYIKNNNPYLYFLKNLIKHLSTELMKNFKKKFIN